MNPQTPQFVAHPWHGVEQGKKFPEMVLCFIETMPGDEMKYEVHKPTGILKIDRPNKSSSMLPAMYGFIPRTYSAERVADFCMQQTGRTEIVGDGDPLDILVLTDHRVNQTNILLDAVIIGGFRMIDRNEADDKIIAVLKDDHTYGDWTDISQCPPRLLKRLKHYFLTYKIDPDKTTQRQVEIPHTYGRNEALEVILRSVEDYQKHFVTQE